MEFDMAGVGNCTDRLEMFIMLTKTYGKPIGMDTLIFIKSFYDLSNNNNFIVSKDLDTKIQPLIQDGTIRFTGGQEFFSQMEHKKFESMKDMKQFIDEFEYIPLNINTPQEIKQDTKQTVYNESNKQQMNDTNAYTLEDFSREVIGIDGEELKQKALRNLNIILKGVPGTGKTVTAYALAQLLCGEKESRRITRIQLNSSYNYTNLMCCKTYNKDGTSRVEYGSLLRLAKKARRDPDNNYVMIIDEISRGRLENILGESITYLEKKHRNKKFETMEGTVESLPLNLFIIGTMNNCDRLATKLDRSISERFKVIEIHPIWGNKAEIDKLNLSGGQKLVADKIAELNSVVENSESRIGNRTLFNMISGETTESIIKDDIMSEIESIFEYSVEMKKHWKNEFNTIILTENSDRQSN